VTLCGWDRCYVLSWLYCVGVTGVNVLSWLHWLYCVGVTGVNVLSWLHCVGVTGVTYLVGYIV